MNALPAGGSDYFLPSLHFRVLESSNCFVTIEKSKYVPQRLYLLSFHNYRIGLAFDEHLKSLHAAII